MLGAETLLYNYRVAALLKKKRSLCLIKSFGGLPFDPLIYVFFISYKVSLSSEAAL